MRIEPAPSEAVAAGTSAAATAAPEPPLEPPGVRSGSQGLRVMPPASRLRERPGGELRRAGDADDDRAGGSQPRHDLRVGGLRIAVGVRSEHPRLAGDRRVVLDRDRDSEQRLGGARGELLGGRVGLLPGALREHDAKGVQLGVERRDALQRDVDELARGDVALADQLGLARHPGEGQFAALAGGTGRGIRHPRASLVVRRLAAWRAGRYDQRHASPFSHEPIAGYARRRLARAGLHHWRLRRARLRLGGSPCPGRLHRDDRFTRLARVPRSPPTVYTRPSQTLRSRRCATRMPPRPASS